MTKEELKELIEKNKQNLKIRSGEKQIENFSDLECCFEKVCLNFYPAYSYDSNGNVIEQRYRRDDLDKLAEKARSNNKRSFYADNINPNDQYSRLVEAEPRYKYKLCRSLTVEEFKNLFGNKGGMENEKTD